ncbi:MAG: adenosine kinase [Candidatus Diapherotrites archaeon]|nr:adenosine kinase [Candidatus Diapherotrites archaeon]
MKTLCVVGSSIVDILTSIDGLIVGGLIGRPITTVPGGVGGNTAANAALLKQIKVSHFGKVGKDLFGRFYKEALEEAGVEDLVVETDEFPTSTILVLIDENKERSFILNKPTATSNIFVKDYAVHKDSILSSDAIYLSAYDLNTNNTSKTNLVVLKDASEKGVEIWLNGGARNFITGKFADLCKAYGKGLIVNDEEFEKLKEFDPNPETLTDIVIVTRSNGSTIFSNGETIETSAVKVDNVVDTTGAGDAFASGFLSAYLNDKPLKECAVQGHELASKIVQKMGARL